jgi:hypothetical protein
MPWLGADHGAVGIEHRMVRLGAEHAHKAETAFPATVQIMAVRRGLDECADEATSG